MKWWWRHLTLSGEPRTLTWLCPCEAWQLEAPRFWPAADIEAVLMEHFVDCAVAQADVITRSASGPR